MGSIQIGPFSIKMLVCKVSRVRVWLFLLTIAPSKLTPSKDPTTSATSQFISDSEAAARSVDKLLNDPLAGSHRFFSWNHAVNNAKSFLSLICQLVMTSTCVFPLPVQIWVRQPIV